MNFLKSILSDEPEPKIPRESDPKSSLGRSPDENSPDDDEDDDAWSFGSMFKTLAMQSETVIEIYRKDLEEFGLGLRKETELFRETASRAVKDLPASIEAAQGAIDGVLKSTVNIISKESLGFSPDGESGRNRGSGSDPGRYSRFEAQVSAIRNDLDTFCVEPEDVGGDYGRWKLGFELENYSDEIERLIGGNGILEGAYKRVVVQNGGVDDETFWCRYFYRVEKLKQKESVRANLVRRAISVDDELSSWDFDDDDDDDEGGDQSVKGGDGNGGNVAKDGNSKPRDNANASDGEKIDVVESSKSSSSVDVSKEGNVQTVGEEDEKVKTEDSNDEKSDAKMVSSHESKAVKEEEDLSWDEIEDTGNGGGKRITAVDHGGIPRKDDHRKPLNGGGDGDDDEDLNWGIEDDDDDEAVKA